MNFTVQHRENTGKGSNRKLREQGLAPGVIYGKSEPQLVSMRADHGKRFILSMKRVKQVVDLTIEKDGQTEQRKVLVQEYQASNVGNELMHVDFLEVADDTIIKMDVPIMVTDKCNALKLGGTLQYVRRAIPVKCAVKDMPTHFLANIDKMEIGDTFKVEELDFPEGVTPLTGGRNFTVLTISGRKAKS